MPYIFLFAVLFASGEPALVTGPVETVAEGFEFTEGPLWLPEEGLIFSDIPADTIFRGDKSAFRKPSGWSNGLTLDREGRLVVCEGGNRRVTRTEKDGKITILADNYLGKKFNSPNDVVVRSDGMIFFTDPPYGIDADKRELPFSGVYAIGADGAVTLLSVQFKYPNGLTFSPDEKTLYVSDANAGVVYAFDVAQDGSLTNPRQICKEIHADGMKTDTRGRVWGTAQDGVRVYQPDGTHVGTVAFPEQPTNCTFGDPDAKTLYVTARQGVYKVRCAVAGLYAAK